MTAEAEIGAAQVHTWERVQGLPATARSEGEAGRVPPGAPGGGGKAGSPADTWILHF